MIITVFNNDGTKPERYSFTENEVTIGRNPPEQPSVVIESHSVSRRHLKAKRASGANSILIMDLNSSNGTFVHDVKLEPNVWHQLSNMEKIKLADFEGQIQFQIRQNTLAQKGQPVQSKKVFKKKSVSSSDSESEQSERQSRSRSRDKQQKQKNQLPFKLSESSIKMLKDMTINKKSKEERIKFLKLMGISKAAQYWTQIEEMLKQKKGIKDSQRTSDELQRQFNSGRSGLEKKGLGKF